MCWEFVGYPSFRWAYIYRIGYLTCGSIIALSGDRPAVTRRRRRRRWWPAGLLVRRTVLRSHSGGNAERAVGWDGPIEGGGVLIRTIYIYIYACLPEICELVKMAIDDRSDGPRGRGWGSRAGVRVDWCVCVVCVAVQPPTTSRIRGIAKLSLS